MDEESFRFENVPQTKEEKVLYIEGLDRASFWCEDDIAEESVQEAGESELELHPETAKYRQDTYSSLTDLNGIDVYLDVERIEK